MTILLTGLGQSSTDLFFAFVSTGSAYASRACSASGGIAAWTIENVVTSGVTAPSVALTADKRIYFAIGPASALTTFSCNGNNLTGTIPNLDGCVGLTGLTIYNNALSGNFPSLAKNTSLTVLSISSNNFTGALPDVSFATGLQYAYMGANGFTGSMPSISANTALIAYTCNNCNLSGVIPTLSSNTHLVDFEASTNQFSGVIGGFAVPASLVTAYFHNNLLTQSAVDAILNAFVAAGASNGTLYVGGTGNAAPSSLTPVTTLTGRGWTVLTN